ncbi:MAG: hypothetical protein H6577_04860 [Lewinellaceae bacterium]|nr:hypothetical protein [Lewinellaceae bacterium]
MKQIPDKQIEPKSRSSNGQTDRLGGAARRSLWKLLTAMYGPVTRAWFSQYLKSIEYGEGLFLGFWTGEQTLISRPGIWNIRAKKIQMNEQA